MLKKDLILQAYKANPSKRKIAQDLGVSRQYVIQVLKDYEKKPESFTNIIKEINPNENPYNRR